MIVRDEGPELLLVTQPDHARFAAEILALWRDDAVARHPRRDDLLFAVREHDNGWRETDAAPWCDPERGCPHDFLSLPDAERCAVWARGTARFESKRPYAALLVTRHGLAINPAPGGGELGDALRAELADRHGRLLATCGVPEEEVTADYALLDLADRLSLTTCRGFRDPFEAHGLRARFDSEIETLYLDPCPLAGATTFRIPARRIPNRHYNGDADLGGELAAATWIDLAVRVAPVLSEERLWGAAAEPG